MIRRRLPILIVLVVLCALIVKAQKSNPSPSPSPSPTATLTPTPTPEMKVKAVDVDTKCYQPFDPLKSGKNEQVTDKLCKAGIGDSIIVEVDNLSLWKDINLGELD
jgi:hypothetical protein